MSGHDFAAMRAALKGGSAVQVVTAPQLFPTPPDVAARMVDLLDLDSWNGEAWETLRILEPSAGTGNLLEALGEWRGDGDVHAGEINRELATNTGHKFPTVTMHCGDFLTAAPVATFDAVIMNPPFGGNAWKHHLQHAWKFMRPGGKLCAILPRAPSLEAMCCALHTGYDLFPLPDGTFAHTGVRTAIVLLEKDETP